jgi:chemosensory pili system protein ChpA (sensor histidine kinase/response regulator)
MNERVEGPADRGRAAPHVLLVDDNVLGRKLVALRLRQARFRVTTASSGEEALAIAERNAVDAVVSDVRMTGMDGFELCAALRADARLADLPVILLSSAVEEGEKQRARALGADCLPRTSDIREAIGVLNDIFRDRRSSHR